MVVLLNRWENTPPDSPRQLDLQTLNPEADVYAIASQEGESPNYLQNIGLDVFSFQKISMSTSLQ
jgi:hypothetical protein